MSNEPSRPILRRFVRVVALVAATLAVAACKRCGPKRKTVAPLCSFDVASDEEVQTRTLTPVTWLGLVSPTIDRNTMTRSGPLRDSCGLILQDVSADETFECPGYVIETKQAEGNDVAEEDLTLSQAGDNRVLAWAATDEFVNGEAAGPVSLVLWTESGVEVHAAGALRGFREGARLRLHYVDITPVLILESDRCDDGGKCIRIAQVAPILARRVREVPVYETGRGCIGRAQFELSRHKEIKLDGRWVRRFEFTRTIELADAAVILTDLVTMEHYDSSNPDKPPTPFRKAEARRPLELRDGRWYLRDEDLWQRVLRDFGSARVRDEALPSGEYRDDPPESSQTDPSI